MIASATLVLTYIMYIFIVSLVSLRGGCKIDAHASKVPLCYIVIRIANAILPTTIFLQASEHYCCVALMQEKEEATSLQSHPKCFCCVHCVVRGIIRK